MDNSVETGMDDHKRMFPALSQSKHRTLKITNNAISKKGGRTRSLMPNKANRVGSVKENLNGSLHASYED